MQKVWFFHKCLVFGVLLLLNGFVYTPVVNADDTDYDLVFIHHSVGQNWLTHSLHNALLAKGYIDERNDIYYDIDLNPDPGRPDSLSNANQPWPGQQVGDFTDMNHWVPWFNDYFESLKYHGCADGFNKIIMFKSCYARNADVVATGTEPGDPFDEYDSIVNHKAVYRHPNGPGNTYTHTWASGGTYTYQPLEDIFAAHPEILFIPVTYPPTLLAGSWPTTLPNAARARQFNNWLINTWLSDYNNDNPGLNNVAPYYLFDLLAYPDNHATYPNILQAQYRTSGTDAHPNDLANQHLTEEFATNSTNFIDTAWNTYISGSSNYPPSFSSENPSDGATNVPITTSSLSVTIEDPEGDNFNWSITTSPDIGSSTGTGEYNGSKICVVSGLDFNTVYIWYVNATDNGSGNTRSEVYTFTTEVNNPPYAPSSPSPPDGATDVGINADLSWYCSDPDGDDLTYNVYFEENDPTPDELVSNNQSENWYDPGTMKYNTTYYWQIVAWDDLGASNEGPIWQFTTAVPPEISDVTLTTSDPLDTNSSFGWINITCDVTDNIAVDEVSLNITNLDGSCNNVSMNVGAEDSYYYNSSTAFSTYGNYSYVIWANDTSNNYVTSNSYTISMPPNWDINNDGDCNVYDLVLVSNHYNETGTPGWIREDVDNNGQIRVIDLVLVSEYYDETWWI